MARRQKSGITWDDAIWKKKVRDLARRNKLDEPEFVRQQAGLFLADVARYAPPYAKFPSAGGRSMGTAKDKQQGEFALMSDLQNIFFVPDDNAVYNWAKKTFPSGPVYSGNRQTGSGVARNLSEVQAWHRKNQRQNGRTRPLRGPLRMWVSASLLKRYFNAEKKNVGKAKAAIAQPAAFFNPSIRVPAWVKRHFGAVYGVGRMTKLRGAATAVFQSSAYGLQHVRQKTVDFVTNKRIKAMESALLRMLKHNAKKSGFRVR